MSSVTTYHIGQRFYPAQVSEGEHLEYQLHLAPFQPEDPRKIRQILFDEYGAVSVLVVNDRRVEFSLSNNQPQESK